MIVLLDGDLLVYRIGFVTEKTDEGVACRELDKYIEENILGRLNEREYHTYITSQEKNNFRYAIYPEYKAGRSRKPLHYLALREHLVLRHSAVVVEGEEADDRLGIHATSLLTGQAEPVICSIDKDLKQIPCWHFNFVKNELVKVTPWEGLRWFYHQLLTGDLPTDNIPGLYGVGPKTAEKWLRNCKTEEDLLAVVYREYKKIYPDNYKEIVLRNGQLLKIRTKEGEVWQLPSEPNEQNPFLSTDQDSKKQSR